MKRMSVICEPRWKWISLMMSSRSDGAQLVDRLHELRGVEPELRLLAAALLPAAEAARRELDAHAGRRRHAHLVGDLEQHVDLAQLLDHDEDLMPELLAHEGEAHELLVLVAVADDQVLGVLGEAENRLQLRLAAALEADAVRLAEFDDLLDDVALLVHLDRIHGGVAAGVGELLARLLEAVGQRLDARAEDVREAEQHRQRDALLLEIVRDRRRGRRRGPDCSLSGRTMTCPFVVDVEEAGAPALDVVEGARGVDRPRRRRCPPAPPRRCE